MTVAEIVSSFIALVSLLAVYVQSRRTAALESEKIIANQHQSDQAQALENFSVTIAQMRAVNNELVDARVELRAELIAVKIEFEALRAANRLSAETWANENRDLRTQVVGLQQEISTQKALVSELKAANDRLEKANAELVKQVKELREQTMVKVADQDGVITGLRAENAALTAENERLKKQ